MIMRIMHMKNRRSRGMLHFFLLYFLKARWLV